MATREQTQAIALERGRHVANEWLDASPDLPHAAAGQRRRAAQPTHATSARRFTPGRILVLSSAVAVIGAITALQLRLAPYETTRQARVDMHVVPIQPQIAGKLLLVHVRPNQNVHAGDLLAELDAAELQQRVDAAKAELTSLEARTAADRADPDGDLETSSAALAKAETAALESAAEQTRLTTQLAHSEASAQYLDNVAEQARVTFENGALTQTDVDARLTAAGLERKRLARIQSAHSAEVVRGQRLMAELATLQQRFREQQRAAESGEPKAVPAQLAGARARYDEAMRVVSQTKLYAPVSGVVSSELPSVGDVVSPNQPVLSIAQHERPWITASFDEEQLRYLAEGQPAELRVVALDLELRGRVESLLFGDDTSTAARTRALGGQPQSAAPRGMVRIALAPSQPGSERLRPGMSVGVRVRVR